MQQNLPLIPGDSTTIDRFFSVSCRDGRFYWFHELETIASYAESDTGRRDEMICLMAERNGIQYSDLARGLHHLSVSRIKQIMKALRGNSGEAVPRRQRQCRVLTDSLRQELNAALIPGIMDYWMTDTFGCPLMHIPMTVDDGFASVILDSFLPKWKTLVPGWHGDAAGSGEKRRKWFTLVFDRAGCSAMLFRKLQDEGIAAMTCRKNSHEDWDEGDFLTVRVTSPPGNQVEMLLAEKETDFTSPDGTSLKVREIRRLSMGRFSSRQTSILTTDRDVPVSDAAAYMFARRDEENFFKYMTAEYGLDHLLDHCREGLSLSENVTNPAWRELKKARAKVQGQLKSLAVRIQRGNADLDSPCVPAKEDGQEQGKNTERGAGTEKYEKKLRKKEELKAEYDKLAEKDENLRKQLKDTPNKIQYSNLSEDERFRTLSLDKKMFSDVVKMAAYRAETAMAFQLRDTGSPYGDEARAFLQGVFRRPADIEYDSAASILHVKVHPLAELRQMVMLGRLLPLLNATETVYPGTNITLRYAVVGGKV